MTFARASSVLALLVLALGVWTAAGHAASAKRTYGITTITNLKSADGLNVAVQKPKRVVYRTLFDVVKVTGIKKFSGWGTKKATAKAKKVKLCDIENRKPTNCSSKPGTIEFDFLHSRKCRTKKGKKAKKVFLYGRMFMAQTDGRGIAAQYSFPSTKADCPDKF